MVRSHALYPTELRAHRRHRVGRDHLAAAPQTAGARILARLPPQANSITPGAREPCRRSVRPPPARRQPAPTVSVTPASGERGEPAAHAGGRRTEGCPHCILSAA